jgi:16S rRNA processing protein RimM
MPSRKYFRKVLSGSPSAGEPEYLVVGALRRPHGLHGEMLMEVLTDFPERLASNLRVFVGESHRPCTVASRRFHNNGLLIKFEGIDTPEAAGAFRGQSVYVTVADRPALPSGQYYHHELVGCNVVDENDESIGTLSEILQTGANDVYVVKTVVGGELLVPVLASVVLLIDADRQLIRVRLPEGLSDSRAA